MYQFMKKIYLVLRIITIIAILGILITSYKIGFLQDGKIEKIEWTQGWSFVDGSGNITEEVEFPVTTTSKSTNEYEFSSTIPDFGYETALLELYVYQNSVWIYVEDTLLYEYDFEPVVLNQNAAGSGKIWVNLPKEYIGKEITIKYERSMEDYSSYFVAPSISNGAVSAYYVEKEFAWLMAGMISFILFGIFLLSAYILEKYILRKETENTSYTLALVFISIATWVLCYNKGFSNVSQLWLFTHNIEYITFYIFPYFFWLHLHKLNENDKFIRIMCNVSLLYFMSIIWVKIIFDFDFAKSVPIYHIVLIVHSLLLGVKIVLGLKKSLLSYKLFAMGVYTMISVGVFGLVQNYILQVDMRFSVQYVIGIVITSTFLILSVFHANNEKIMAKNKEIFAKSRASEYNRYEIIVRQTGELFFDWDSVSDTVYISSGFEKYFGISFKRDNFSGRLKDLMRELKFSYTFTNILEELKESADFKKVECKFAHPTEGDKWFSVDLTAGFDSNGLESHIIGIIKDITVQKELETDYSKQMKFNHINSQLYEHIFEVDLTNNLIYQDLKAKASSNREQGATNKRYTREILRISKEITHYDYQDSFEEAFLRERMLDLFDTGTKNFAFETLVKDGDGTKCLLLNVHMYQAGEKRDVHAIIYSKNITEEKEQRFKLEEKSKRDPLTHLLNKGAVRQAIKEGLLYKPEDEKYALFMIDVDYFKQVNDTLGHLAGDRVLIDCANKIKGCFREQDIIGRFGGDEFTVLMRNIDLHIVEEKCKYLNQKLNYIYEEDGKACQLSLSLGVTIVDIGGNVYDDVYKKADEALYESKEKGRNTYTILPMV